jgi:HAD superfamily hydrolase (TIGR01459 family)
VQSQRHGRGRKLQGKWTSILCTHPLPSGEGDPFPTPGLGTRLRVKTTESQRPIHLTRTKIQNSTPPILERAGSLLANYDVLFCDVWGVVHDGHVAFKEAGAALTQFRKNGGSVILVSNAPVPQARVAAMLDQRKVSRTAWDAIVSSGDIALTHMSAMGYSRVYGIGPRDRDAAFFAVSPAQLVGLEQAEAIVCTGLNDDLNETAENYRDVLEKSLERKLPFVCANPDLVVDVGGRHYWCAGAIADLYEHLGGDVYWAGKPHTSAYSTAHATAERLRGETVGSKRILAIGDAIRTDLAAAHNFGVDAIFVASGIHRHETMENGQLSHWLQ